MEKTLRRVNRVAGPEGLIVTLANLPSRNTRWVPRRKAEVVIAVRDGVLSLGEACNRYCLSLDELAQWQRSYNMGGLGGQRRHKASRKPH
jgi:hypothetical protein